MKIKRNKLTSILKRKNFLLQWSLYSGLFILLMTAFYAGYSIYIRASASCMTVAQVQSDSRCLYIVTTQIYEKGSRSSPHHAHPCGSDVTNVLPASHLGNIAFYLTPNFRANVCPAVANTPTPLPPTPTHTPTNTPIPTNTPFPTPTQTPINTPFPTQGTSTNTPTPILTNGPRATFTPTPSYAPGFTPTPTAKQAQTPTLTSQNTQTQVSPTSSSTFSSAIVTNSNSSSQHTTPAPNSTNVSQPYLSVNVALTGIGNTGNTRPLHPTRQLGIYLYSPSADLSTSAKPLYSLSGTITYISDSTLPTYGYFTNTSLPVNRVTPGSYKIAIKINGFLPGIVQVNKNDGVFSLSNNQVTPLTPTTLLGGDIAPPYGIINTSDYQAFVNCYGDKFTSPSCTSGQLADLNDDGIVDGVDYQLMVSALQTSPTINSQALSSLPSIAPSITPAPQPTKAITPIKDIKGKNNFWWVFALLGIIILGTTIVIFHKKIVAHKKKKLLIPPLGLAIGSKSRHKTGEKIEGVYLADIYKEDPLSKGFWLKLKNEKEKIYGYYKSDQTDIILGYITITGVIASNKEGKYILVSTLEQVKE